MKKPQQITDTILMVRPAHFGYNEQTAGSNAFQSRDPKLSAGQIEAGAIREFDLLVKRLREAGIRVIVARDSEEPVKPDAVFPNNWVTFHENGTVITYPMFAPARRAERREEIIRQATRGAKNLKRIRLEKYEDEGRFLEGTGSMVLDRVSRIVYACASPRTDLGLLSEFCDIMGYEAVSFTSLDAKGQQIYHTNVMMALGESFVVICLDTILDENEKAKLQKKFSETNKEIIEISLDQMMAFAGNMLQVKSGEGERFLVMSEQAYRSLNREQIQNIKKHTRILHSPIDTIEKEGGGSVRCMMTEVF